MGRKSSNHEYRPSGWQLDANNIKTETVQYWQHGIMKTAQITNADARRMINDGVAFVISDQAIGAMVDGRSDS